MIQDATSAFIFIYVYLDKLDNKSKQIPDRHFGRNSYLRVYYCHFLTHMPNMLMSLANE